MIRPAIDLNADLGEGCDSDAGLMRLVSSCNIACGGHAGDAASMRAALSLAGRNGVAAGAHPSFPDRISFGRAPSTLRDRALEKALSQQVEALKSIAADLGVPLHHLKPHGALYNQAAVDADLALSVARVTDACLPGAALYGPPRSAFVEAAAQHGLRFVAEGFADRTYEPTGQLRARTFPDAVLTDPAEQVEQALSIAQRGEVATVTGERIALPAQTLCLHGDTPGALQAATQVRAALIAAGIEIRAAS